MTRFARTNRVFLIEEPLFDADDNPYLQLDRKGNLTIIVPHLQNGLSEEGSSFQEVMLLRAFFDEEKIIDYLFWYYTPMALAIGNYFSPKLMIAWMSCHYLISHLRH
jgi:hypothetical protein